MKRAFTLVEMLIVVVIIGIVASAFIPRLTGSYRKAYYRGNINITEEKIQDLQEKTFSNEKQEELENKLEELKEKKQKYQNKLEDLKSND